MQQGPRGQGRGPFPHTAPGLHPGPGSEQVLSKHQEGEVASSAEEETSARPVPQDAQGSHQYCCSEMTEFEGTALPF